MFIKLLENRELEKKRAECVEKPEISSSIPRISIISDNFPKTLDRFVLLFRIRWFDLEKVKNHYFPSIFHSPQLVSIQFWLQKRLYCPVLAADKAVNWSDGGMAGIANRGLFLAGEGPFVVVLVAEAKKWLQETRKKWILVLMGRNSQFEPEFEQK